MSPPLTLDTLRVRAAEIKRIVASHGARNVRVFGSIARGEFKAGSDLDILVDLVPGSDLFDLIETKIELEEALGLRVDVVSARALSPYIRDDILTEAVAL